jgi:hypothetical protein
VVALNEGTKAVAPNAGTKAVAPNPTHLGHGVKVCPEAEERLVGAERRRWLRKKAVAPKEGGGSERRRWLRTKAVVSSHLGHGVKVCPETEGRLVGTECVDHFGAGGVT